MAYADSKNQRGYIQRETTWGTIPNSTGAATVAAGDAFLFASLDMNPAQARLQQPDKTGNLGQILSVAGRRSASWSMSKALRGSGSAGTAPDHGALYEALLGKTEVVNAATSIVYGADDNNYSVCLWEFVTPTTVEQRVISGAVITSWTVRFGQDFCNEDWGGEGKEVIYKANFSSYDSVGKSGLTAFPSEPGSQTVSGSPIVGHKGTITLDGQTYTTLRSGSITVAVARELPKDGWNSDYPLPPSSGTRTVTLDLSMYDDDSANFTALRNKAINNTAFDCTFALGTVAGNILTVATKNVLLPKPAFDYSATRRVANFSGAQAHMTSISSKDDITLTWT